MRESGEDYLETILNLIKRNPDLHAVEIANELKYSKPSVTRALKRLVRSGFIQIDGGTRHITLTDKGLSAAEEIADRHGTLTKFWVLQGVEPEIADRDACRMEHGISPQTYARVKEIVKKAEKGTDT